MTPQKKQKLRELKTRLETLDQQSGGVLSAPELSELEYQKRERPVKEALVALGTKYGDLARTLGGVGAQLTSAEETTAAKFATLTQEMQTRIQEIGNTFRVMERSGRELTDAELRSVGDQITTIQAHYTAGKQESTTTSALLRAEVGRIDQTLSALGERAASKQDVRAVAHDVRLTADDATQMVEGLRKTILSRLSQIGSGNANRNIAIGGNGSVLNMFTDINLKAGNNVTITYQNNTTTKYTDVTISATGGGSGSVGGVVRSINTIAASQSAGSDTGTDYVYLCTTGLKLTLPAAAGNTNLYTIKNISNSSVLVSGTIDNDATGVTMPVKYTSIDVISNTVDWDIT